MDFNLFTWIREGVKQSVLLGVSDAIETIGTPENAADINPRLLEFMRRDSAAETEKRVATGAARKRLGRSLKDVETESGAGSASPVV